MKFEIRNLSKTYGDRKILDNINYKFEDYCFYSIVGESGCGKTTLLNILSLITEPDSNSEILFDSINYLNKKEEDKRAFRLSNIGYIFQSFNLFENDTVSNNIALVIDSISHYSNDMKKRKIREVLKQVDILNLENKFVKDLSGGEKQRVAIARALVNNPRIIFADEPTGSLDTVNSDLIFSLLRKISANCIVICVTHDEELAQKYSNFILRIENKTINEEVCFKTEGKKTSSLLMIERKKKEKGRLSDKFIYRHLINKFKAKKVRTFISMFFLVLSLFSIGLGTFLKNGIGDSLKKSFSSIINENTLVLSKKNSNTGVIDYFSSNKNDVLNLEKDYSGDIEYCGCTYLVNFEMYFKDRNYVTNISRPILQQLEGYNARSFNEFKYVKDFTKLEEIYPRIDNKLSNDELVLSMNHPTMINICKHLQIERTFESLGKYINTGKFKINIDLENKDWRYDDNVSFRVKAVVPSTESMILHNNNFFNEWFFEEKLRFPSSLNIKKNEEYPWTMKKIYYFKTKKFQSSLLNKLSEDQNYQNYIFDSDNYNYSPKTCAINKPCYTNKVFMYTAFKSEIPYVLPKKLNKINSNFKNYYYSTEGGYINLGTDFFSGFSKQTYFSFDKEKLENLTLQLEKIDISEMSNLVLQKGVLEGNVIKTGDNIVRFSSKYRTLLSGQKPEKMNEICISKKMAGLLGYDEFHDDLYVSMNIEQKYDGDEFKNIFYTIKLKVVGVIDSEKVLIFNEPSFTISLFRDFFNISSFKLLPNSIVYEFEEAPTTEQINKYNEYFEEYEFKDPLDMFSSGIEETLSYLEWILIGLSIVTMISSILLISIINYIDVVESKKDYAILTIIGFSKKEILRLQFYNCFLPSFICFLISSFTLLLTSNLLSKVMTDKIGINTEVSTSYISFLAMFLIMIIVTLITTLLSKRPIKNINIAKELHTWHNKIHLWTFKKSTIFFSIKL